MAPGTDIETTPLFHGPKVAAPRGAAPFRWERAFMAAHTWVVYFFLYAPILILIVLSFNAGRHATVQQILLLFLL